MAVYLTHIAEQLQEKGRTKNYALEDKGKLKEQIKIVKCEKKYKC